MLTWPQHANDVGILTFNSISTTSESLKARKVFIFHNFSFYEQLKFHADEEALSDSQCD